MRRFSGIWEHEWVRSAALALVLIGAAMMIFAVYQYVTSSYAMGQNIAYQTQARDGTTPIESQSQAQQLFAADLSLRELNGQRNGALIIAGVGLVLLALGWLGRDAAASALKKREPPLPPPV